MMFRNYLFQKIFCFLCTGNTALSYLGRLSGGERIIASAKILSRRILQAEAPGASAFFDHQRVHFSAFHFG